MQHFELQEQIPLYAVGGLATEESARLAEHLNICPSCRALLSEYQFVADELAVQVPSRVAPERVGIYLQNVAEADARNAKKETNVAPNGASGNGKPRFWNQRLALPRWAWALGLAVLLLFVGVSGTLAWQSRQSNPVGEQIVQLLSERGLEFVPMAGFAGEGTGGFLCVNAKNQTALLWLYGMDSLDHDKVYQVWLKNDDERIDAGTFRSNYDGRAVAVIHAPRPFGDFSEIGVTVEPAAGSDMPTSPRVVGGRLD